MCVLSFSVAFVYNVSYSKKNLPTYEQKCLLMFYSVFHKTDLFSKSTLSFDGAYTQSIVILVAGGLC